MFNKSQFGTPTFGNTSGFTTSAFGQNTATPGFGGFGAATAGFGTATNTGGGLFGSTQNKPGGLFGSSSFGQPATSSTNAGFGFGTSTSNSLFGGTSTGGLFSNQQSNAFTQSKPAGGFGSFGASTTGGGLFGTTSTASNPFGGTSGTLFGGTTFSTAAPTGTTVKFNPPTGTDTMVKSGVSTNISTKHQCITAMKEYETKSLEELRLEDYTAGRKGPQAPLGGGGGLFGTSTATSSAGTGLFGATPANPTGGFNFGQNKTGFGANTGLLSQVGVLGTVCGSSLQKTGTGAFGTATGGLFGQPQQQPSTGLFGSKPFGLATTTQSTGFGFGTTNTLGQPNTSSMSLFGTAPVSQSGGIFGTNTNTSTGNAFGAGGGLFGNTNAAFTNVNNTLFANKPAGFGTATTSASAFGTAGAGLFGNKPNLTIGANANTSNFGFGATAATGGLFGNKPATGALGTTLGGGFGSALGAGQTSLFGSTQPKLGTTLGAGTFGTGAFNAPNAGVGFGTPQAPVCLTDPNASATQQAVLQQQLNALAYTPFGDSPLFRNPMVDPKKKEERLKPTNPAAQKALTTPTHYKLTPRPATRVRPKALQASGSSKSQLFDGLDDDEPTSLSNGTFLPRKSIKKLVLKSMNNSTLCSPVLCKEPNDLASPSDYPENGENEQECRLEREDNDQQEVNKCYTNTIVKPIPQTPEGVNSNRHQNSAMDDTITEMNLRNKLRNGILEGSSEDPCYIDGSLSVERDSEIDDSLPPHPAGIVLTRVGYYTIPSMDELAQQLNENGECIVENFTIGRKGYGSIYFPGVVNLTNMNLDEIVHVRRKEVIVYLDDEKKPLVGEGLNRRAEVTLDGVWPTDKTTRCLIKSPERLMEMGFEERLESSSRKQGARFLEYRSETGSWVFEVTHFSKYGLQDSDEEDSELPSKAETKKMKTAALPDQQAAQVCKPVKNLQLESPLMQQLGRVTEFDSDMADITQEPMPDSLLDEDISEDQELVSASSNIASSLGINPHSLQVMKASLLSEDEDVDKMQNQHFAHLTADDHCQRMLPRQILLKQGERSKGLGGGMFYCSFPKKLLPFTVRPEQTQQHSPTAVEILRSPPLHPWPVAGQLPSTFSVPSQLPELQLKTVGIRRHQRLVPMEQSVTNGKGKLLMDMALFAGRSFRVGWAPNCTLCHSGQLLSHVTESETDPCSVEYNFFPKPAKIKHVSELPFKVHVEKVMLKEERARQDLSLYTEQLEIALRYSHVGTEGSCPFVEPEQGVDALHEYAAWIQETEDKSEYTEGIVRGWSLAWTLCEALWGNLTELEAAFSEPSPYIQQLERRKAFSRWLSRTAEERIEEEVAVSRHMSHVDGVFSYLTGKRISEACKLAQQSGDHRLALLLAQAAGSQQVRELLNLQLADWNQMKADPFIQEERLKIFALLAGKAVWISSEGYINVCSQLDWKRCLAVHLWYMLPPRSSIAEALNVYSEAFQGSEAVQRYARYPLPPYLEDTNIDLIEAPENEEEEAPHQDICYHLLKLYSDRHYELHPLLNPRTVTADYLDYRLSWHLWMVLQAMNYTHLSEKHQTMVHTSFAAQLEAVGLWEWAIFVLLHIPDAQQRGNAVQEQLNRHCSLDETEEQKVKELFLQEKLGIPPEWIHSAKSLRAHRDGDIHKEALHLIEAGQWNKCHQLVVRYLASDAIINENYSYLKYFLERLAIPECSLQIQDWETAGAVFYDYICIMETVRGIGEVENPTYELEKIHNEVMSLCSRIELIECVSAKDRLAQSDMAKQIANMLRTVLGLQHSAESPGDRAPSLQHIPLRLLAPYIRKLPMPEDYALEELRSLTQSYLRELVVGP
ncbi:nuclear pore complex protein Nup98-Nup96 isoform X1 [Hemiscyllium ocellatum]|uniref:nuclear pore complex protein Nup98-Nup96 isoform X1 n=1 Tax=Hemiscyllium ocellatum TaxID=170820 RepID=UPI002965E67D|nr:nuclear pore complex protein Nup98-Nup96 isoform X1 [Hemiscyllium ocellatum]